MTGARTGNPARIVSPDNDNKKARGRIVDNQENLAVIAQPVIAEPTMLALPIVEPKGFTIEDILWSIGIWSVLLTMSPVVVFYMLMVA